MQPSRICALDDGGRRSCPTCAYRKFSGFHQRNIVTLRSKLATTSTRQGQGRESEFGVDGNNVFKRFAPAFGTLTFGAVGHPRTVGSRRLAAICIVLRFRQFTPLSTCTGLAAMLLPALIFRYLPNVNPGGLSSKRYLQAPPLSGFDDALISASTRRPPDSCTMTRSPTS
jgi:hypothetical protein